MLSTLADAHTRSEATFGAARALTDGFGLAFEVGALFCLAGAAVAALLLGPVRRGGTLAPAPHDDDDDAAADARMGQLEDRASASRSPRSLPGARLQRTARRQGTTRRR